MLAFWERERIFERLRELRGGGRGERRWSFLDGPITANNPMGVHHAWGRTYKDVQQRFHAMLGYDQRYQNGFDCQGLWVEVNVERDLKFNSKRDIEAFGIEPFVRLCKQRVLEFAAQMTEQSIVLGQWMRWDDPETLRFLRDRLAEDPSQIVTVRGSEGEITDTVERLVGRLGSPEFGGSYYTLSDENNYCIWTFLKRCHGRGLIYKGRDSVPWFWRCGTAISDHEIESEGYQERTHQAVFVRLPITSRGTSQPEPIPEIQNPKSESLLVWTTTPWTLPANVAVAVGPEIEYARIRQGEELLYVARATLERPEAQRPVRGEYELLGTLTGEEMLGWTYQGPFDELEAVRQVEAHLQHVVIPWRDVGAEEGTGLVHIAPGCGKEDFQLGREHGLPAVAPLDESGHYLEGFGAHSGEHATKVAGPITRELREKGLLYRAESYTHRYPTCWRCKEDLVFRLVDEWFISMGPVYEKPYAEVTPEEKAASLRYQIMDVVQGIRWIPAFGLEREMDWLRNMQDWMISKKRYWGLALPIWGCEQCDGFDLVGSREELRERAIDGWEEFEPHCPHRPYVDAVTLRCDRCQGTMRRIPDVGNPWLDAGIVSFSTIGWRADRAEWERWFPADFITESFPGQFRNWFYSLLTMSTVLDGRAPFRACLGFATLFGEDGKPMHKSGGNLIEFDEGAVKIGVDVMRWMFVSQRPEANLLFGYNLAREARRQFLIPLWNCYKFFADYASLDGWTPDRRAAAPGTLDRWLTGRLQLLVRDVTTALENFDHVAASQALVDFVESFSTWYIRRSRRRVWKSESDEDKLAAYGTLHETLVTLTRLLAPLLPFVAETMHQNLSRAVDSDAPVSVHLCDWPRADMARVDEEVLREVELARDLVSAGLAARAAGSVRVRQPVARVRVFVAPERRMPLSEELRDHVREELNVKAVEFVEEVGELATYRVLPNNQLLGPRLGKQFPLVRQALLALDPAAVAQTVLAGEPVGLPVDGGHVSLAGEEVLIQTQPRPGLAVATERGVTVGVDTGLTPELLREGDAREVVRQIQSLRKEMGLEMDDRIDTRYQAAGEVARAMEEHADYLRAETLSLTLEPAPPEGDWATASFRVRGEQVTIWARRANQ